MKWGKNVKVVFLVNVCRDGMGVVCVIMLLSLLSIEQFVLKLDCNVSVMDYMSIFDLEEEQLNSYGSFCGSEDFFLVVLE